MGLMDILATDSITITPKGTVGGDGRRTWDGAAVSTVGRVVDRSGLLRPTEGREVTYDRVVYLKSGETVAVGDKITHNSIDHEVVELRAVDYVASGVVDHYKAMVKYLDA